MKETKIKITSENIETLINTDKLYLTSVNDRPTPIGDYDVAILAYCDDFTTHKATIADIDSILANPTKTISITQEGIEA
jgi:hypothetical protein